MKKDAESIFNNVFEPIYQTQSSPSELLYQHVDLVVGLHIQLTYPTVTSLGVCDSVILCPSKRNLTFVELRLARWQYVSISFLKAVVFFILKKISSPY